MCTNWKRWCRLCGLKEDNEIQLDISPKLIELARHHLLVKTLSNTNAEWPMLACHGCVEFLLELERFADRCRRMEEMFEELSTGQHKDILALRKYYALDLGNQEKLSEEASKDSLVDQSMVELNTPVHEMEHVIIKEEDQEIVCQIRRSIHNSEQNCISLSKPIRMDLKESREECDFEISPSGSPVIKEEDEDNVCQIRRSSRKRDQNSISINKSIRMDLKEPREECDLEISASGSKCVSKTLKTNNLVKKPQLRKNSKLKRGTHKTSDEQDSESSNSKTIKSTLNFSCQPCQLTFERPSLYARHMRYHHPSDDLPLSCSQCPKRFAIPLQLRLHKNQHLSADLKFKYPCPHCGKKFTKANSVKTHIQARHLRLRPFICEHCGATFATKGALKDHNLTHTDERTVACSQCPKMFKSLAKVKEHEHAIHSDIKYPCPHCDALLNTKKSLRMHKLVHTDETRYKCQYCGKGYKRSNALKSHLILHTGQRPFACPFCDKTYASSSNCYNHKKKCHPDEFAAMKAAELLVS